MQCISPTSCDTLGLQQCHYCAFYQMGAYSPNFPVPAIPVECNIGSSSIWFWLPDDLEPIKIIWRESSYTRQRRLNFLYGSEAASTPSLDGYGG